MRNLGSLYQTGKDQLRRVIGAALGVSVSRPANEPAVKHLWSIGMYAGESPFDLKPIRGTENPVLSRSDVSDVQAGFVADPFMLCVERTWYMFFEVWNCQSHKGEIGLATSQDGLRWVYQQIVLAEPFHLSYPYVFQWMNQCYLVPESYQAGSVRLYQAVDFPIRWAFVGELLTGSYLVDASLFRYHEKWWMYAETNPEMKHDTLRLYSADELRGPWREHPTSPVMIGNGHGARPAGRVLCFNDSVVRYAQDCDPIYGTKVFGFEITELTTSNYNEREWPLRPVLSGSGNGWNSSGMHHIDAHRLTDGRWLACVDGWRSVTELEFREVRGNTDAGRQ